MRARELVDTLGLGEGGGVINTWLKWSKTDFGKGMRQMKGGEPRGRPVSLSRQCWGRSVTGDW